MKSSFLPLLALLLVAHAHAHTHVRSTQKCVPILDVPTQLRALNVPVDPCTLAPLSDDTLNKISAVVIAAHPDDETIAMSGWVTDRLHQQKLVMVEMMTDGWGSGAQGYLGSIGYPLNDTQFGDARLREYVSAMRALGTTGIRYNHAISMQLKPTDVAPVIDYWYQKLKANVEFNAPASGEYDSSDHPDHTAIFTALMASNVPDSQKIGSLVYAYRISDVETRWPAGQIQSLTSPLCDSKHLALNEYKVMDPTNGRYAIGWTYSTPDLFQPAYNNCKEFHVLPKQAPFQW